MWWGERLFEAGRLLTFSAFRMSAYSLIQIKILYFIDKMVFRIFKLSKLDLRGLIISIWFLLFFVFSFFCIELVFSLTWPASMQIYWNKRKRLHKKRIQLPQGWFGTPTWSPFHCFGTPISLYMTVLV